MAKIDFTAKSDRELLILTAQSTNDITDHLAKINGTLLKHENRLTKLESKQTCFKPTRSLLPKLTDKMTILILIGSLLGALIYSLGRSLGFW